MGHQENALNYRLLLWISIFWFMLVCPLGAEEIKIFKHETFQGGPWVLKADTLIYHTATQTYEASGKAELRQGERRLSADYMKVNGVTKIAEIQGSVVMVLGDDILSGKTGQFNLVTRCGELTDARIFIRRNHFHINSALIRKTGENTYYTEKSVITTCDADQPMWSFYSREMEVKVDGYAVSKTTTLRLGPVPVAVLPTAVLPVQTTRQSGFLMPHYSQHQMNGTVVELPFYWAINNYMDATFYPMLVSHRGFMPSLEYRYAWDKNSGGTARFSYIDDHKSSAPTPHRYWGAAMFNQNLPQDWVARGVLDIPSDSQYLYDYDFGYQALGRLNRAFALDYGRNLEQFDVKTRVSSLILERRFSLGSINLYGNYYRSLSSLIPQTLNKAPSLQASTLTLPLGSWPLGVTIDSDYTNYYQSTGLSGQRLDVHPRLALATRVFDTFDLNATSGWRGTGYLVDRYATQSGVNTSEGRSLYDVNTSVSTPIFRDWGRTSTSQSFVRHIFTPKITYCNIANFNVNRIPKFDPFDYGWQTSVTKNYPIFEGLQPIGGVNAATYSFTNHFIQSSPSATGLTNIRELFWSRITQSVFFNSSSYGVDTISYPHHRMSDVFVETLGYPVENIGLGLNGGFSPYREGVSQLDVRLLLRDSASKYFLNLDYVYFKNYANQINSELFLDLFNSIKIGINNQHTFTSGKQLENKYQLIFQRQCWGLAFTFADRIQDKYFSVSIIIPGLVEKRHMAIAGQPTL
jgi:LPS-assembly protein